MPGTTVIKPFQAYLITLANRFELVARVARRFMPRLKTESEVATMAYLREKTGIPVPTVYYYDSNPYNRLGGEYILMSKVRRHHARCFVLSRGPTDHFATSTGTRRTARQSHPYLELQRARQVVHQSRISNLARLLSSFSPHRLALFRAESLRHGRIFTGHA